MILILNNNNEVFCFSLGTGKRGLFCFGCSFREQMVLEARVWSFRSTAHESIRGESLHVLGDPDLSDTICQDPGAEHRAIESLAS